MSKATFIKIGHQLCEFFNTDNISEVKILDVGHGHGCGLIDLSYEFGITPVGIEKDTLMYKGSLLHLKLYIEQQPSDHTCIPFIPINGDGLDLSTFGGAEVAYCWGKGAPVNLMHHMKTIFVNDETCKILITSKRYDDNTLMIDNLKRGMKMNGTFHTSSMVLYFYERKKQTQNYIQQ